MVRPSIGNLAMVTLMAIVGIWALKAVSRVVPIPGFAEIVRGI
jgi:hypothetical protein